MKKLLIISILSLVMFSCEKKEPQVWGDLLIVTEFESTPEENVEVTLYSSFEKYENYEFVERQLSDEYGEVYFTGLLPGWYYFEGEKAKSSLFTVYAMDSIQVVGTQQVNKILVMKPAL